MNKVYLIFGLILFTSCANKNSKLGKEENSLYSEIEKTFSDVDSLLKIDNEKFWNHQLYGSILFVNPKTREFVANKNNSSNAFKKVNSVYLDTLPKELNIANTAIHWNNERWTMVMLPLPTATIERNNLIIHELFHRIQPEIGFGNLQELDNGHLDKYEGRLLLKLELEALKKALMSNDDNLRDTHIKNAFLFRNKRQVNKKTKTAENALEINEGLAEYTAIMLSGRNEAEMKLHLTNSINKFYDNPTFVRSYAYQTTPIYGYLLSKQKKMWQKDISSETNLTDYYLKAFNFQMPKATSYEMIAKENDYNYQRIVATEEERENERLVKIANYKTIFLENPTLKIRFENMNISFDPRNITPLENIGTVYPNIRVTDNWGILTVKKAALLSSDWTNIIISAPTKINDDLIEGDGWTLELNKEWEVKEMKDKFELIKK